MYSVTQLRDADDGLPAVLAGVDALATRGMAEGMGTKPA